MRLRPHHLFCVQGYKGTDTEDDYLVNLRWIADRVWQEPYTPVEVVDGPDDVCAMCPHLKDGLCLWKEAGEDVVRAHDAALFSALGLADGQTTSIAEIRVKLQTDPAVDAAVRKQCAGCPWLDNCAFMNGEL
ncbi:MAG: DUF1284 domain-containing protein [Deltaproteobacteria bacterium]|nr:DUF1284 domain-containing protein [Deltaproteobacteria bacterium]